MESLTLWNKSENIYGLAYSLSLFMTPDKVTIQAELENKQTISVLFDRLSLTGSKVWSAIYTSELYRGDLTEKIQLCKRSFETKDSSFPLIYLMENSNFIKRFDEYGYPSSEDVKDLKHFVFVSENDIVEVLSEYDPKVSVIDKKECF
ncbi:hypothetical protein [Jeotgalibacillus proteolyticus]|uniref:hypothetical protein n=1 Tax=Jeotgalibacillus proteolyticus TaxID=2082395 RepID=UPI003CE95DD9